LVENSKGGEKFSLFIEMACNGLFGVGNGQINEPDPNRHFSLRKCEIGAFDEEAYGLMVDFKMIAELASELPEQNNRASQALIIADEIINKCDTRDRK
jgi:alpha-mannosidase